jgi:metallo-beta-lactamase class B
MKRGENTTDDPQYGFGREANEFPRVASIHVVGDGDVLTVGPLTITAHATPGHTPGSTTWTWKSCEESRCLDIVYADSLNAVSADGFKYSNDPARVAAFRKSIATVAALPCDIALAPHPDLVGLADRLAAKSFVDPAGCRTYAGMAARALDKRLAGE